MKCGVITKSFVIPPANDAVKELICEYSKAIFSLKVSVFTKESSVKDNIKVMNRQQSNSPYC